MAVRVTLPYHLRNLAQLKGDVFLEVASPVTMRSIIDAIETTYPALRGTVRDYTTGERRPFLRFFVGEEDWSLVSLDDPLPDSIAQGREPFIILGAIAGG